MKTPYSIKAMVASAALLGGVVSNAAIVSDTTSSPSDFGAVIGWTPGVAVEFYSSVDAFWSVSASLVPAGAVNVVTITGSHNYAPHAGEVSPNPNQFMTAFVLPADADTAVPASLPHPGGAPLHNDDWSAIIATGPYEIEGNNYDYGILILAAHPVPEPHEYALFAGLGLVAFGAYRRFRTH